MSMRPLWSTRGFLARSSSVNKARMWTPLPSEPPCSDEEQRPMKERNLRTGARGQSCTLSLPLK